MSCQDYCAGRLRGIVENLKLRGEVGEDFHVEIRPVPPGLSWIPRNSYIAKCEHGRQFLMREARPRGKKKGKRG